MKKYGYAGVTEVIIERAIKKITVIIYSVKPGMIIGRGGKGLEEVKKIVVSLKIGFKGGWVHTLIPPQYFSTYRSIIGVMTNPFFFNSEISPQSCLRWRKPTAIKQFLLDS